MSRTFAYCRVSTSDQTTDNQANDIRNAGFALDPQRVVREVISGSTVAAQRPAFAKLLDRLEAGDVLIVTKLDRLGRNTMDVLGIVKQLEDRNIRVYCLALGGMDLTSSAGKMTMAVLAAVAEFERDLLIERTRAGLETAKGKGKTLGRKPSLSADQVAKVKEKQAAGASVASISREFGVSRATVMRECGLISR